MSTLTDERRLSYVEALREATQQEMRRDPSVILFGQGVDDHRGTVGTTLGLADEFGAQRVFDTPLSEDAMTGVAIGAAMAGLRPMHVHIRQDFLLLCMNQLVNMAAKAHYMYGGSVQVPLVVRSMIGKSWGQGAQHSQALHALFMHIPGLKVVAPTTPYDAKGALVQSLRDNNPVVFVEHRMLHFQRGHVPEELYAVPFGRARTLARGADVTLVGISHMAVECLRARAYLAQRGVSAEVIDPVSLVPLDIETIRASATRTGHVVIVDNGWTSAGASAEILAQLVDGAVMPPRVSRLGFAPTTCPTTRPLEDLFYPTGRSIAEHVNVQLGGPSTWSPREIEGNAAELEFKGPF
jgi:pyruvate/2-oxoglutarate/acetoin dehydrogenase E1 component